MNSTDNAEIGLRIRTLRKRKGYNQQELADVLGKSLRTVQKYESGEIEVSIAVANQLAEALDTTPTFLFGYETEITPIRSLADVLNFLFHIEQVSGLEFGIDVKKPPRSTSPAAVYLALHELAQQGEDDVQHRLEIMFEGGVI